MSIRSPTPEHDPLATPPSLERDRRVRDMFGRIASRYDRLNRVLSFGIDRRWRQELVRAVAFAEPLRILDVATGTADLALALKRRLPGSEVVGVDVSEPMLAVARDKAAARGVELRLDLADGMALPFADASFDLVTVAYGLRNFSDRRRGLAEFRRVLRPGGRLAVLEFPPPPDSAFGRVYRLYFRLIVPLIGALVSGEGGAYRYLPASVETFPDPEALSDLMRDTGFENVRHRLQSFGISALHLGDAPQ